jgi:hypothetical protein
MVKSGTKWRGDEQYFRVISVAEIDGKSWVHYRKENSQEEPREFSCLEESFLARFTPIVNE